MGQKTIYDRLRSNGMTKIGACAMLGNIQAESGCESIRLQSDFTTDRRLSKKYVQDVDNGSYASSTFINDSKGFGLIQWTFHSRKRDLYNYAKQMNKSIGDEQMQVDCIVRELKRDYNSLWNFLLATNDLYSATDQICRKFERPAVNNVRERYNYAKAAFDTIETITDEEANSNRKSLEQVAKEVLRGSYGNGGQRRKRLEEEGYPFDEVQRIVSQMAAGTYKPTPETIRPYNPNNNSKPEEKPNNKPDDNNSNNDIPKNKSLEDIAREVLIGKWGNGPIRKKRLEEAGYPFDKVQSIVNRIYSGIYKPTPETTEPYNPNKKPEPEKKPNPIKTWPPRTLRLNMEGHDIAVWQALLIANGYICNINGIFDQNTFEETKKYQKRHSLTPNGIVNYSTWRRMLTI